jgi:outer membrane protein OmpA-like peptidoglycan-associated protein
MRLTALVCIVFSVGIAAAQIKQIPDGKKEKIKGVISARNGPDMTVEQSDNTRVIAVLNDYTQVKMKEGGLGFRKKTVNVTLLVPGLSLEVDGVGNANGQLTAEMVLLTRADVQASREIQAGNAPLEAQQQQLSQEEKANRAAAQQAQASANLANQRISDLNKYTTKYKTDVYFGNDQISLSPEAEKSLSSLASEALSTNAYMVQVAGYASSTGSAQVNEELSNERADAVIAYLTKSGHIPLYRVLAPAAMGASSAAGGDQALNRRVLVKVVVNQGIAQ